MEGERAGIEIAKNHDKKVDLRAQCPPVCVPWGSVRFCGAPPGSVGFRRGPLAFPIDPIFHPPSNTNRLETTETSGNGDGGMKCENGGTKSAKSEKIKRI